jgi:hypothetical protein
MAKIDKNQKSWSIYRHIVVKHKDKLEWCQQLYLRECMKNTPSMPYCHDPCYFTMYNQTWDILRAGWNPTWADIAHYPEEVELDDIITIIDKRLGFVNIKSIPEYKDPQPDPKDLEWYDEDRPSVRDIRSKSKQKRRGWKNQHIEK